MATRSYSGIVHDDKSINYVYCHFDSYRNLGILKEHYNTPEKVNALIEMGDMSALESTLEKCIFYGRDKDEDVRIGNACCLSEFLMSCVEDYTFLFKDGNWLMRTWGNPLLGEYSED